MIKIYFALLPVLGLPPAPLPLITLAAAILPQKKLMYLLTKLPFQKTIQLLEKDM